MPTVAIVFHSNTGHTAKLSEAVEEGAASVSGVDVQRLAIVGDDIVKGRWDNPEIMARLDPSDAIIFGAPTSMGDVSGPMKCFLDSTSKHFYPRVGQQPGGRVHQFVLSERRQASHADDVRDLRDAARNALDRHNAARFEEVAPKRYLSADINRLGGWTGVMATAHPWESPEVVPNEADLSAGRALGRRVSEATLRWRAHVQALVTQGHP